MPHKQADYVYAEYQSPTFGFIDDVEFYFPPGKSTVEYRSASRIGESDGECSATDLRLLMCFARHCGDLSSSITAYDFTPC